MTAPTESPLPQNPSGNEFVPRVTHRPVEQLRTNPRNARTHSKRQIRQIAESIRAFGFLNPVLVDQHNTIMAGHGRVEAAKLLGRVEVPTIRIEHLTADQLRAYVLADNKLAEIAGWDPAILAIEFQHLLTVDSSFDVTVTGFEIAEIDLILEEARETNPPEDRFEVDTASRPVTQRGDLWVLDKHRLLCADALEKPSYTTLMDGQRAHVVFTDPPYNVRIDGHAGGNGSITHREFVMASGEMSELEFTAFLNRAMRLLSQHSTGGSLHYLCMDWRHMRELLAAGKEIYDALINLCVWAKDNGGMGSFYRSRHELVFVFRNGNKPHRNNIQLGQFGRNRSNVWDYPGINTLSRQSEEGNLLALHPTVKPVAMVADAILDCSMRGDIVLDPFLGSGTTLIAAERVGRRCYGMDIDPLYVDTAVRRWQRLTGERAVHAVTGRTFDEQAAEVEEVRS